MYDGLYAKFSKEGLIDVLLDTEDAYIEECAPYDDIWGTKRSCDDSFMKTKDIEGKNQLGKGLMEVRERLMSEIKKS